MILLFICFSINQLVSYETREHRILETEDKVIELFSTYIRSTQQCMIMMSCIYYNQTESKYCDIFSTEINGKNYENTTNPFLQISSSQYATSKIITFLILQQMTSLKVTFNQKLLTRTFRNIYPTYEILSLEKSFREANIDILEKNTTQTGKFLYQLRLALLVPLIVKEMQIFSGFLLLDQNIPGVLYEGEKFISLWVLDYIPLYEWKENSGHQWQTYKIFDSDLEGQECYISEEITYFNNFMMTNSMIVNCDYLPIYFVIGLLLTILYNLVINKVGPKKQNQQQVIQIIDQIHQQNEENEEDEKVDEIGVEESLKYLTKQIVTFEELQQEINSRWNLNFLEQVTSTFFFISLYSIFINFSYLPFNICINVLTVCSIILSVAYLIFLILFNIHGFSSAVYLVDSMEKIGLEEYQKKVISQMIYQKYSGFIGQLKLTKNKFGICANFFSFLVKLTYAMLVILLIEIVENALITSLTLFSLLAIYRIITLTYRYIYLQMLHALIDSCFCIAIGLRIRLSQIRSQNNLSQNDWNNIGQVTLIFELIALSLMSIESLIWLVHSLILKMSSLEKIKKNVTMDVGYQGPQNIEMIALNDEQLQDQKGNQTQQYHNQDYDYQQFVNYENNSGITDEQNILSNDSCHGRLINNSNQQKYFPPFKIDNFVAEASKDKYDLPNNYYEYQRIPTEEKFKLIHKLSIIGDRIQSFIIIEKFIIKVDIFFQIFFECNKYLSRYIIILTNKSEEDKIFVQQFKFELVDKQQTIQYYNDDNQDILKNLDFLVKVVKLQNFTSLNTSDFQKLNISFMLSEQDIDYENMSIKFTLDASTLKFLRNIPCDQEEINQIIKGFQTNSFQSLILKQIHGVDEIFVQMMKEQLKLIKDSSEVLVIKYEIEILSSSTFIYVLIDSLTSFATLSVAVSNSVQLTMQESQLINKFGEQLSQLLKK